MRRSAGSPNSARPPWERSSAPRTFPRSGRTLRQLFTGVLYRRLHRLNQPRQRAGARQRTASTNPDNGPVLASGAHLLPFLREEAIAGYEDGRAVVRRAPLALDVTSDTDGLAL